ncbi:MAG: hypothetical protein EHM87_22445 [Burkholderiales bacterium]|nr:MAG: hypothetical protein EHM87_22445 [Burkholderiales bacterium]
MKPETPDVEEVQGQPCGVLPLDFVEVKDYTTFLAEYTMKGQDFVFHFFRSPERAKDFSYWLKVFPVALERVAVEHFQAGYPRVSATYVDDMESWWLGAKGFGTLLDKDGFAHKFLEKLDQMLDTLTVQ